MPSLRPIADCALYCFIDTAYLHGRPVSVLAKALCEGGADVIQLRAKRESPAEVETLAREILPVVVSAGVPLVINDHLEVARHVGAPWCHLGQEDFFEAGHRHVSELAGAGSELRFGLSTHAPEQARRAEAAGAGYLGVGPVFPTQTKPGVRAVTLDYVRWAATHVQAPWFAIGGITLENLDDVIAAGATRICVVSAILNASDVAQACRAFKKRLPSLPTNQKT